MKLTKELIDQIQEAMLHTKKDGREEYMKEYATQRLHNDIKKENERI